ncbi:probable serine carboxypeptidase CPVL isoform X2 [Physella acuta]|uniref:probable serine carboxypeptidase CPVL isoform X1 n=1 Tax=Physella acuta TaxID=109671 RepID=UPI0027DC7560|nr:probable serine carboxypeptidase CPVL isoform X1 [Physella acuta]XP_059152577.1 probable serine carboxypeptidase CPVL isoform X2 [Physella acuta]
MAAIESDETCCGKSEACGQTCHNQSKNCDEECISQSKEPCHVGISQPEGQPLFLSKFLEDNRTPEDVLTASRVVLPNVDVVSYSGYITVNPELEHNLFFWLFPAKNAKSEKPPLVLYLNGGPGNSSMIGLFEEVGPLKVGPDGEIAEKSTHWAKDFSLLFVDNPVGVGFSFCKPDTELKTNLAVADSLYEFLIQFLQLYPQFQQNDLYLGGLSYAGKYVPAFAHKIHQEQTTEEEPPRLLVNLKGIFIGGGFCSPEKMLPVFPEFLTAVGMLTERKKEAMVDKIQYSIDKSRHLAKHEEAVTDIVDIVFGNSRRKLGYEEVDNLLITKEYEWHFEHYLNRPEVQHALHVRPTQYTKCADKMPLTMAGDFFSGVVSELELLLENYKVLMFSGQMDLVVSTLMTEHLLSDLSWSGRDDYLQADKVTWKDKHGEVAGYVTKVNSFTRVVIRNAGHRSAIDQPEWTLEMITKFINDEDFSRPTN